MRRTTYIQAINEALREEMQRDEDVFLIGEDIGHYGGLFRVTRNLLDEFGDRRVLDTPISEQAFMGMALGAAIVGMRPVVELMYMDFTLVAADQIFNQIAKYRYMTGGLLKVPVVIRGQQGGGKHYGSQHSQSVDSLYAHFPGIRVVAPATPYDAKGLLKTAIRDDNPVAFLEHKMLYFTRGEAPPPEEEYLIPLGKADVKRVGTDVTIATFSYCLHQALEAAETLAERHGVSCEVVDLRTVEPLDTETVWESVAKTGTTCWQFTSPMRIAVWGQSLLPVSTKRPPTCCRRRPAGWAWHRFRYRSHACLRRRFCPGRKRSSPLCWR